ncbi:MAG: hypothetical protein ACOX8D_05900, partial [Methanoculleus sp.]
VMGAGSMPEVGRGVQLQRAIFVSYCQKEGGGKPAFKINLTPMDGIWTVNCRRELYRPCGIR